MQATLTAEFAITGKYTQNIYSFCFRISPAQILLSQMTSILDTCTDLLTQFLVTQQHIFIHVILR